MKKILIVLICILGIGYAEVSKAEKLTLFAKSGQKEIKIKWIVDKYSSKNNYKIFRSTDGSKFKYLTTIKPRSYNNLKERGYSDDYIFLIYPDKNIKNFKERIKLLKIEGNVQGFRNIKVIKDNQFAKNIGQYFSDTNIKKNRFYIYLIQMFKDNKFIYQKMTKAQSYKRGKKNDFMWIEAKNTKKGVALSWSIEDEFALFNIYRKKEEDSKFKKINKNTIYISNKSSKKPKAYFVDNYLKVGEKASYYVRKIDNFSQEGKPSKIVKVTRFIPLEKPPIVKNIFLKKLKNRIILRWQKLDNTIGYNVYRSSIYQDGFKKINKKVIKGQRYIDKNIQKNKNYYYYITALNMSGESTPSIKMTASVDDTTPPQRPSNLIYKTKPGRLFLKWRKPKDRDIAGYRIYTSMDENAKQWSLINKKLTTRNHFGLKLSKKLSRFPYFYRVTAVDKNYNESFPSNIIKIKFPDVTAPKAPHIMHYSSYMNRVKIEWNKIFVYDFSHYNVYRKSKDKIIKINKKPITNNFFIDINPKNQVNTYTVTAVDKSGNESEKKDFVTISLIDNKPVKIKNFKLKRVKNGVKASFNCLDKDYSGFKLFKSSGKVHKYFNVSNFVKDKKFIDTQVSKKGVYFYMIKAYDKAGNIAVSKPHKIVLN